MKFGRRSKNVPKRLRASRRIFHGVAIKADIDFCCGAAADVSDRRFLADEAPMLPLDECSNPGICSCVYEHFDDRRTNFRRESDEGLPQKYYVNDARIGVGRRVTDG